MKSSRPRELISKLVGGSPPLWIDTDNTDDKDEIFVLWLRGKACEGLTYAVLLFGLVATFDAKFVLQYLIPPALVLSLIGYAIAYGRLLRRYAEYKRTTRARNERQIGAG